MTGPVWHDLEIVCPVSVYNEIGGVFILNRGGVLSVQCLYPPPGRFLSRRGKALIIQSNRAITRKARDIRDAAGKDGFTSTPNETLVSHVQTLHYLCTNSIVSAVNMAPIHKEIPTPSPLEYYLNFVESAFK
jgi:hypothetical protein